MRTYQTEITVPLRKVYRIPISVPLPLKYTYAYALDSSEGWVLIDLGMDVPEARLDWQKAAEELHIAPGSVNRILITHYHPDHLGLAGWAEDHFKAPISLLQPEMDAAQRIFGSESDPALLEVFLERHGMPRDVAQISQEERQAMVKTVVLPQSVVPLFPNQELWFGDTHLLVLWQRGHTDHQALFYMPDHHVLFTGDQILSRITPNVSVWPDSDPNPLQAYLQSLDSLLALPIKLGLPAHEAVLDNTHDRIQEIVAHHHERSEALLAILRDGPRTAYQAAQRLFSRPLPAYQMRFALSETLAHLEYLRAVGAVAQFDDVPVRYRLA